MLFRSDTDWQANACISQWSADWAYSNGFRRAALQLAQHVCDTSTNQDILVYPIVYLYRHHIELVLKSIIRLASGLIDQELSERNLRTLGRHSLLELWEICRPLLNVVCEIATQDAFPELELDGVDSYIRQIHDHDPDGQRVRYATTKVKRAGRPDTTAPSLRPDLEHINIRVLSSAMERLADYLENTEGFFEHLEEGKREYECHYGS